MSSWSFWYLFGIKDRWTSSFWSFIPYRGPDRPVAATCGVRNTSHKYLIIKYSRWFGIHFRHIGIAFFPPLRSRIKIGAFVVELNQLLLMDIYFQLTRDKVQEVVKRSCLIVCTTRLHRKIFANNKEVKQVVQKWLQDQPKELFSNKMRKLRYGENNCINIGCDFVGKYFNICKNSINHFWAIAFCLLTYWITLVK